MRRAADHLRPLAGPIGHHVLDEFAAGRLDRRALLRHAARVGLITALPFGARAQGKPGATIRVASLVPNAAIDPVTTAGIGGLVMLMQAGEFLLRDGPDLVLRPMLAVSWSPNADGSVWIFKLRPGVRFHDGQALTAADVVATFDRLANPANGSNALSALRGVLSQGGARAVDDLTVAFQLDAPNGNFPYYVSSDNYNAIILPANYAGAYERDFNGTGPFRLERYTPRVGASFVRNEAYWGGPVLPARTEWSFYADQQPQVLALQAGQVDVVTTFSVQGGQALLSDPDVTVIKLPSSQNRMLHMKNDAPHFSDKRVRQAIALTLDRPGIVRGLFRGNAVLGNDSPIAPIYPSAAPEVPQRARDLDRARALMAEAGLAGGFDATLTTERVGEMADYAVLVQNACAAIGVRLKLKVEDQQAYYGAAKPGVSDWLDSEMGITDYGHRGVPNVMLAAPMLSTGTWNAAHFHNAAYDALVADYVAATDLGLQRAAAGKIGALLLEETPAVFAYFYNMLTAVRRGVTGVEPTAIVQLFLQNAAVG